MKQIKKNSSTFLFTLLIVVLIVVSLISYIRIQRYDKSVETVLQTKELKDKIIAVNSNLKDAEIGQRGYLLTNDSVFLQPYFGTEQRINLLLASLDSLFQDKAIQQQNLNILKTLVGERYLIMNNNLTLLPNTPPDKFKDAMMRKGKNKMEEVKHQVTVMLQEEEKLEAQRNHDKNRAASLTPLFIFMLSLLSIIAITLFFFRLQKETGIRMTMQEKFEIDELARKQIEASEQRFRNILEQAPDPIMIFKEKT